MIRDRQYDGLKNVTPTLNLHLIAAVYFHCWNLKGRTISLLLKYKIDLFILRKCKVLFIGVTVLDASLSLKCVMGDDHSAHFEFGLK